jgi:hypothetical protein
MAIDERMWCAGCGKPMGRIQCCGKGYWSPLAPQPNDAWALERKVFRPEIEAYLYLYRFSK